jgi:serine/alanine racemase
VAIHTSPLASISNIADFILTRVIARVAVPFFFMTSGFFLFSNGSAKEEKIKRFLKKTSVIYLVTIVLYIPINFYAGYFYKKNLLFNIIKDIIFDGTIYHLWYLPAAILGVALVSLLIKYMSLNRAFIISCILYFIGVFGDSYYKIAAKSAVIKDVYKVIFIFSDYTRNGIFFAPIFLLLGSLVSKNINKFKKKEGLLYLYIFVALMMVEALLLRNFNLMRHDSMYFMLIPCMYFLFSLIVSYKVSSRKEFRNISLLIYLIHPMVIIMIRGGAKFLGMKAILVDNSIIHYILVTLCSGIIAVIIAYYMDKKKDSYPKNSKNKNSKKTCRSWIEINMGNLEHNVKELKSVMPKRCKFMAVVKANAYGHGAIEISRHLNRIGVDAFAVATIDEAIELRKNGIQGEILILGYTDVSRANELNHYHLIQTVIDYEYACMLNSQKKSLQVHIKIDTGMHRLGIPVEDIDKISKVFHMDMLKVTGIFTHLCVADQLDEEAEKFTKEQIDKFYGLLNRLELSGITIPKVHIQSSYGLLNYPQLTCDYARIGIALYGCLSTWEDRTRIGLSLRPVLSLKSKIAIIRNVEKGEGVSYGRDIHVTRDSRIAVLPLGYADGLPRNLSDGTGSVLIHGTKVPIVGRICMDQLLIDVTDMPKVKTGDIATLIGIDGKEEILAANLAKKAGTITNELLSRLGGRIERVYLK